MQETSLLKTIENLSGSYQYNNDPEIRLVFKIENGIPMCVHEPFDHFPPYEPVIAAYKGSYSLKDGIINFGEIADLTYCIEYLSNSELWLSNSRIQKKVEFIKVH